MALTKIPVTIIATGTINAAGGVVRGTADLRASYGGWLTIKLSNNGALGAQAVASVLMAHTNGPTPAPGSAGVDWKTIYSVGNGVVSGVTTEWSMPIDHGVNHIEVEVTGNTTNGVTCEAFITTIPTLG